MPRTLPSRTVRRPRSRASAAVLCTAAMVATGIVTGTETASVTVPSAGAAPLDAGSPVSDPGPNRVTPDWSGLDVTGGIPLSDEVGVPAGDVPLNPGLGLASAGEQHRFAYSTHDQHGDVVASTAAVFLPTGDAPAGGWPVLAWAHGTVGLGDECTPSAQNRSPRDTGYLNHWLDQGYAVVASDYAGLGTPGLMSYLNGSVTAANVIDSVAAANKLDSVGTDLSTQWAVIGQSQGGGAALHVAHEATARSREAGLDYRGAVATGAPAYIEELVLAGSPSFPPVVLPAGLNVYSAYIIAGFREAHPEIDVDSVLTAEGRRIADMAETACYGALEGALDGVNMANAFARPLRDVPGLEPALRDYMATPTSGYDRPVFLAHGLRDMDVPTPVGLVLNSEMWLKQFTGDASANAQVNVRWYDADHSGAMVASMKDSTPFLESLFR